MLRLGSLALVLALATTAAAAAGCLGRSSTPLAPGSSSANGANATLPRDVVKSFDITVGQGVGAVCPPGTHGCYVTANGDSGSLAVPRAGATRAMLDATWTPATPAGGPMEIDVFEDQGQGRTGQVITGDPGPLLASAHGPSPLKLDLSKANLDPKKKYVVWVGPDTGSASNGEKVHFTFSIAYP